MNPVYKTVNKAIKMIEIDIVVNKAVTILNDSVTESSEKREYDVINTILRTFSFLERWRIFAKLK